MERLVLLMCTLSETCYCFLYINSVWLFKLLKWICIGSMCTNALYWFETQLLSRGYCCFPLLGKLSYWNCFLFRAAELQLCIQTLWRSGSCTVGKLAAELCYTGKLFVAFCMLHFHWFGILTLNDRLQGSSLVRENTFLKLVEYQASSADALLAWQPPR